MLKSKRLGKFISPFVTLVMLVSAIAGIARAEPKQQEKRSKLEFGIGPSVTFPIKSPVEDYYKQLNEDFRTGKYTARTPIADATGKNLWEDIKKPKFNELGVQGSCLIRLKPGEIKSPRVGIVVGYKGSSSSSEYNKTYDVWDDYAKASAPLKFKRQETISTNTASLGAIGKVSLTDKLDVSVTVGPEFRKVKGNVDYTMDRLDDPYIQYRKADFNGSGTGYSLKVGLDYEIWKNFSFGAAFGYRGGKVKTKGEEVTSWPDTSSTRTKEYNPKIDFNSTCVEAGVKVKF